MGDKELLELAAKAAKIEHKIKMVTPCYRGDPNFESLRRVWHANRRNDWVEWNPLEDDGDALRLACDLALQVFPVARTSSGAACSAAASVTGERLAEFAYASVGVREATRRAIVRAAAEIGRNME